MFNRRIESGFTYKVNDKKAIQGFFKASTDMIRGKIKSSEDIPEPARGMLVYEMKFERDGDALPGNDILLLKGIREIALLIPESQGGNGKKTANRIKAFVDGDKKKLDIDLGISLQRIAESAKDLKKAGKLVRDFIYAIAYMGR